MANVGDVSGKALSGLQALNKTTAQPEVEGPSFGDILKQSLQGAIDAQHKSEQVSAASLVGKADMTEVLQAVNNAQLALNTVLAVRDRLVQAYEQIMRTSI
jgi:flagellar hook-basal body complex protein FliE